MPALAAPSVPVSHASKPASRSTRSGEESRSIDDPIRLYLLQMGASRCSIEKERFPVLAALNPGGSGFGTNFSAMTWCYGQLSASWKEFRRELFGLTAPLRCR